MFDIFATILSAGVVISVVTLVVHEPLLLAAGISTILGLMFLLLPFFTTMVPVLGYLLIFTGIVGLGYGVLSTRSWLNVLHARRLQALHRRQQLQAARAREDGSAPLKAGAPLATARIRDEDAEDELPPRLAAQIDREDAPSSGKGSSALARVGRRLGQGEPEPEIKPAGKPWRNPYGSAPGAGMKPQPQPLAVEPPPPPPAPPPQSQPEPQPVLRSAPRPVAEARAAKADKPLSRGAERIKRIKDESRRSLPVRRVKPTAAAAPPAVVPVAVAPVAVPEPPPSPPPVPQAQAVRDDASTLRARRQRDLMELDLLELDQPKTAERRPATRDEGDEPRGNKPFLSRMARRS